MAHQFQGIERLRREYRLTGVEIGEKPGLACSTAAGWLARLGLGRLTSLDLKPPYGATSAKTLVSCCIWTSRNSVGSSGRVPDHRVTGSRKRRSQEAGWDYLHVPSDDATRLVYVEVLPDETCRSSTGFLIRALSWFKASGVKVERVMTDNGSGYIARLLRRTHKRLAIHHIRIRPTRQKPTARQTCQDG